MMKILGGIVPAVLLAAALTFPAQLYPQAAPAADISVDETGLAVNDGEQPAVQLESEMTGFTAWDFVRMVLVLGAVIALIYALFMFLKKIGNPKSGGEGLITLLASQPLNGNRALHLIQVGNEVFLVGSADGGVSLVSRLEDKETLDRIALYESDRKSGGSSFANTFRSILGDNGQESGGDVSGLFLRKQRERLKKL